MGSFYGSIHLKTDDMSSVKNILEDLKRKKKINFFLSPPLRGWISLYPAGYGQDISKSIARKIKSQAYYLPYRQAPLTEYRGTGIILTFFHVKTSFPINTSFSHITIIS